MKEQANFKFNKKDKEKWKRVASLENRSLTNLIETVMNNYAAIKLSKNETVRRYGLQTIRKVSH